MTRCWLTGTARKTRGRGRADPTAHLTAVGQALRSPGTAAAFLSRPVGHDLGDYVAVRKRERRFWTDQQRKHTLAANRVVFAREC